MYPKLPFPPPSSVNTSPAHSFALLHHGISSATPPKIHSLYHPPRPQRRRIASQRPRCPVTELHRARELCADTGDLDRAHECEEYTVCVACTSPSHPHHSNRSRRIADIYAPTVPRLVLNPQALPFHAPEHPTRYRKLNALPPRYNVLLRPPHRMRLQPTQVQFDLLLRPRHDPLPPHLLPPATRYKSFATQPANTARAG